MTDLKECIHLPEDQDMDRVPSTLPSLIQVAASGTCTPLLTAPEVPMDPILFRETLQNAFNKSKSYSSEMSVTSRTKSMLFTMPCVIPTPPPTAASLAATSKGGNGVLHSRDPGVAMMRDGWMVSSFPTWLPKDSLALKDAESED